LGTRLSTGTAQAQTTLLVDPSATCRRIALHDSMRHRHMVVLRLQSPVMVAGLADRLPRARVKHYWLTCRVGQY